MIWSLPPNIDRIAVIKEAHKYNLSASKVSRRTDDWRRDRVYVAVTPTFRTSLEENIDFMRVLTLLGGIKMRTR